MQNLLLSTEGTTWALYVLVALLVIGNIVFIALFISSVVRNNKLEDDMRDDLMSLIGKQTEKITSTSFDKERKQPVEAQPKPYGNTKYKMYESKNKDGWYITENGKTEKIAYAKSKEEAQEIIKNLCRNL
ncbi:MAG: hypothetical protein ACI4T8_00020 [Christensenellales bacterium]